MQERSSSHRFPLFDGLRALAVIGVAYSHWMPERFHFGIPWGRVGVQLFFVLSGFLITTILLREYRRLPVCDRAARWTLIRAFVARRALRIFPIYWLTLLIAVSVGLPAVRESFWWHFLYASNFLFAIQREWQGPVSHLWTLAVEEQFYVIWPFLIVFAAAMWRIRIVTFIVALCALVSLLLGLQSADAQVFLGLLPVPAFLGIASGALMAIARDEGRPARAFAHPAALTIAAASLAGALALSSMGGTSALLGSALTPTCIVGFAACVIAWASETRRGVLPAILQLKPLVFLGTISYGFYLYHNFATPIFGFAIREGWLPQAINWGIQAPLSRFGFTLLLATASWYAIERPLGRLRERIAYTHSSPPTDQQAPQHVSRARL